jgi:hypothetical protein
MRTLFIINRCKHNHLNYVRAVAPHCAANRVVISYMANDWLAKNDLARADSVLGGVSVLHPEPVDELEIDLDRFDAAVRSAVHELQPEVVHMLYYLHDHLVVRARGILDELGSPALLIYETRDPSGILRESLPEKEAIEAADGYIFVSHATFDYFFDRYLFEPRPYLVIRQSEQYANRDALPKKQSDLDGRTHVTLLGWYSEHPDEGRHYEEYIRAFADNTENTVLHAFSHRPRPYLERLETELDGRFVNHEKVPEALFAKPPLFTSTIGAYDFNLVAHMLWAKKNEREVLRYCNPTKATSPLVLADLPFLCTHHYQGIREIIDEYGCGMIFRGWSDLNELFRDRDRWAPMREGAARAAKELCLEAQGPRVTAFYREVQSEKRRKRATTRR